MTILATYATACTFTAFEPCHLLARTGFVSLWHIQVSDEVNFALLRCNVLQQTCIFLPSPVNTNIRKQRIYQQFSYLQHFAIKKHNIYFQSSSYQIIVQWNRLILLEGPDLPSILLTVSVTKEKLSTQLFIKLKTSQIQLCLILINSSIQDIQLVILCTYNTTGLRPVSIVITSCMSCNLNRQLFL